MKNLATFRNNFLFVVQFSNSVSKTRTTLLFTIKNIEMFEIHVSTQGCKGCDLLNIK